MTSTAVDLRSGAPRPLLSHSAELALGARHREVLDDLERLFLTHGFTSLTVAQLARGVGCSRRTLYELAPTKAELVLLVLDRFLHRIGREAIAAIDPAAPAPEQIHQYLRGGLELQRKAAAFAADLEDDIAARRLLDTHLQFVVTIVERIIEAGMRDGEIRPVRPAIAAGAIAGSALFLSQASTAARLGLTVDTLVDEVLDFNLAALQRG